MIMDIISVLCVLILSYEVLMAILLTSKAFWKAIAMISEKGANFTGRFVWGTWSIHIMCVTFSWLFCRHVLKIF